MKSLLLNKLISLGYPPHSASMTIEDISNIKYSDLQSAIKVWIHTGKVTFIEEGGFSTTSLMKKMTYPAAIISINWLREEPEEAKNALTVYM